MKPDRARKGDVSVDCQAIPFDRSAGDNLAKIVSLGWSGSRGASPALQLQRKPEDLRNQLIALHSGRVHLPKSFVDFSDRVSRSTDGSSSWLRVIDAKVYDVQRRCALEHRFIRHDVLLSTPMYDAIHSILWNEWDFSQGFDKERDIPIAPSDKKSATLEFEDIGSTDVLSVGPNPAERDRPGTIGDVTLATHRIRSIKLVFTSRSANRRSKESFRLLEQP